MKRFIVTAVAVAVLTVGTAGVAAAQTGGTGSSSSSTQPSGNSTTAPKANQPKRRGVAALVVAAKTLGIKPRDLAAGLCSGQTVAQIASQHGKSTQDVINALVKVADARIDKAVKAGRLDATQAAQRKTKVEAQVTTRINAFKPSATRCQKLQGAGSGAATPSST